MKKKYFVSKTPEETGEHEVHAEGCPKIPSVIHRKYIGEYLSCKDAVSDAKGFYYPVDGCKFCSPNCHSR